MAEITANTAATPAASTEPAAAPATAATTPASTPTPVTTAPKAEDIATAFLSALENRTQRVVIHYRFVGYIELPDSIFKRSHQADTRQGVRVNYLRSPFTA